MFKGDVIENDNYEIKLNNQKQKCEKNKGMA